MDSTRWNDTSRLRAKLPRGQESLRQAEAKTVCGGASAEPGATEGKRQVLLTNHDPDLLSGKERRLERDPPVFHSSREGSPCP